MKKLTILFVLACFTAVLSVSAYGDGDIDGPCNSAGAWFCGMVEMTYLPSLTSLTTAGDMKEAYAAQVRDDAAAYVAADGQEAASSVLQNAMDQIRARYSQARTLSDLQLAQILLGQVGN